jgi:hypothetical protein
MPRDREDGTSSGGATSNQEPPSMPLLTELIAFYVTVAIKISLLRSYESIGPEASPEPHRDSFIVCRIIRFFDRP